MGWGWCSGTLLCGDLAISRGVNVSFRSWDALLDERLPVGMSQVRMASDLRHGCPTPYMGAAGASAYGKSFEGRVSGVPRTRALHPSICLSSFFLFLTHSPVCFCFLFFLKSSSVLLFPFLLIHLMNQKYLSCVYDKPSTF